MQLLPHTGKMPVPQYQLRQGSGLDRALLVKFMQLTYQELFPDQDFSHLAATVDSYLSVQTPLWWVEFSPKEVGEDFPGENLKSKIQNRIVACLWLGNAIDQVWGDRHAHVFLLYVQPKHRRQGIGTALMCHAEDWARNRGDRQIGLQVFGINQPALHLYEQLGYKTESLWMVKPLSD